jgi:hypothetical protein
MPSFTTQYFEFDQLEKSKKLDIERGVPYAESETIHFFKDRVVVPTGKGGVTRPTLAYTAYGALKGKNIFVLGWNHALLIERSRSDGAYYVHGILAYGESASNYEARVYELPLNGGLRERTDCSVQELPASTGYKKASKWRLFDLSAEKVRIDKLVTFGITSCSFACLFPKDSNFLVVSHIAFAPPIPVFWLMELMGHAPKGAKTLNLLASLNVTTQELAKYTRAVLPRASKYDVDAKFFLRGPYQCRDMGDNAPYRTHPYVTLRLDKLQPVQVEGALGYNNEPGQELELPPLHSCMGEAASEFRLLKDAKRILELEALLVNGALGFQQLHLKTLLYLADAELKDRQRYRFNQYKSAQVDGLMAQVSKDPSIVPDVLRGHERAVFLLAELVASSAKDSKFKLAFGPVLQAWQEAQLGFSFQMDAIHSGQVALNPVDSLSECHPPLPRSQSFSKAPTGATQPPALRRSASVPKLGK